MLHVNVTAIPTQGQYQRVTRMEKKKMNYLENIVNNETEWRSVLNVEKDLNQMLKIMNPKKTYESTF